MVCPSVRGCLFRHSCWRGSGVLQLAFAQTGVMLQVARRCKHGEPSTPGLAVCVNLSWPAIPAASKQTSKSRALQAFAKKTQTGLLMRGAGVFGKTCFQLAFSARPQGCGLVWAGGHSCAWACDMRDMRDMRYGACQVRKSQNEKSASRKNALVERCPALGARQAIAGRAEAWRGAGRAYVSTIGGLGACLISSGFS